MFERFFARQLARPSGLFGRYFMAPWLRRKTRLVNRWALECLSIEPADRILEIGFGSGDLLERLLEPDRRLRVAGLDISETMVARARMRLRRAIREERLRIEPGSIEGIPFGVGSFSKVITVNTVYFWTAPDMALAECRRVLQAQGRLLICFDAKEDLQKWPAHRFGFTLYEPAELEVMLVKAGFEGVEWQCRTFPDYGKVYCLIAVSAA